MNAVLLLLTVTIFVSQFVEAGRFFCLGDSNGDSDNNEVAHLNNPGSTYLQLKYQNFKKKRLGKKSARSCSNYIRSCSQYHQVVSSIDLEAMIVIECLKDVDDEVVAQAFFRGMKRSFQYVPKRLIFVNNAPMWLPAKNNGPAERLAYQVSCKLEKEFQQNGLRTLRQQFQRSAEDMNLNQT